VSLSAEGHEFYFFLSDSNHAGTRDRRADLAASGKTVVANPMAATFFRDRVHVCFPLLQTGLLLFFICW